MLVVRLNNHQENILWIITNSFSQCGSWTKEREIGKRLNMWAKLVIYHAASRVKHRVEPMVKRQIPINTEPCCPAKLYWTLYWIIWASIAEGEKLKGAVVVPVLMRFLNYCDEDNPNGGVILTLMSRRWKKTEIMELWKPETVES